MFKLNTEELTRQAGDIDSVASNLASLQKRLGALSSSGSLGIGNYDAVRGAISRDASALGTVSQRLNSLSNAASSISKSYAEAEAAAHDGLRNALGIDPSQGSPQGSGTSGGSNPEKGGKKTEPSWFSQFIQGKVKAEGSVKDGEIRGDGTFLGIAATGAISGGFFNGEASFKPDAKWDITKGNFYAGAEGKVSGSVAKVKAEGDYGILHGEAKGEVFSGAVKGKLNATLVKDGKFNPQLAGELSGEGSVLSGELSGRAGGEYNNVHGKADGSLLGAEGEVKFHAGKDGFGGSVKGGVYAAKGSVKGGFSILGIKVDVGLDGYAGSFGGQAGFGIDKNKVQAKIGGSVLVGGGLDVSIDFSDAGAGIKKTIDWWNSLGKKKKKK